MTYGFAEVHEGLLIGAYPLDANDVAMLATMQEMEGTPDIGLPPVDLSRDVFMGHEFAGEILDVGPGTEAPAGSAVVTDVAVAVSG